jgi:RNA polymerase sigma-70 factor (ECF subfamily)
MSEMPVSGPPSSSSANEPQAVAVAPLVRGAAVIDAYAQHHEELFSFILTATRDREAAEDVLQEAFLRLLREDRAGRMPEAVRPWLYRVASNLVIDRGRKLATGRRWLERLVTPELADPPEAVFLRREQSEDLERALMAVPAEARVALLMSGHGFSGEEIAAAIGRSHVATRSLMCRARVRLRQHLAEQGIIG